MFRIAHMFRDRGMFAPGGGAPFGVANLQADPNCVLAQLPDYGVWGLQDFPPGTYTETERYQWAAAKQVPWLRRNYVTDTEDLSTANWTRNGTTVTTAGITPPSGRTLASKVTHAGASGEVWTAPAARWSFSAGARVYAQFLLKYFDVQWIRPLLGVNPGINIAVWVDVQNGVLGTAPALTAGASSGTQQLTALADGWYQLDVSVVFTAESVSSGFVQVNTASGDASGTRVAGSFLCTGIHAAPAPIISYQPIGASWDATYAALAAAAGFNPGIWQDAGTNPVNTSGQSVYRIADASGKGYTADQATAANRPLWTLDANAKPYLLGDNVNDAMPVTFPASFSSNASVYVTTDAGTTVTDGVTLNGSYAPLVAAKQYARVIFKSGRPAYHEKLIRWLNAKAGL